MVHLVQSGIPELSTLTVHMRLCSTVIYRVMQRYTEKVYGRDMQRRYAEEIY